MLMLIAAAALADAKPVRASFTTTKPRNEVTACVTESIRWMGTPTVSPNVGGGDHIVVNHLWVNVVDISVRDGDGTVVDIRSKVPGRLRRAINDCL